MKYCNEFNYNSSTFMKVKDLYYEHNISIHKPLASRFELFILTVLSVILPFHWYADDYILTSNSKIVYSCIGIFLIASIIRKIFWGVKEESLLIIKSLGLQSKVTYQSNCQSLKFIPWHLIDDVIINEAILMQRVIYYLAVILKTEEEGEEGDDDEEENDDCDSNNNQKKLILPLFLHAQPRLGTLKEIYSNIQEILET